jgi:hypothetical protein
LKDQHQAALVSAKQEAAKATEEHLATKDALSKAQAEVASHKAAAEKERQKSQVDFNDMHDTMTQLVEETNNKAAEKDALLKELEANMKVKDAELAELKVSAISYQIPTFTYTRMRNRPNSPQAPQKKPPKVSVRASTPTKQIKHLRRQPPERKVSKTIHQPH